jgi:hypothetical protein
MGTATHLAGRNEVLGDGIARIAIGQHAFELVGRGQYHEQVQTELRFTTPFTYRSLRGERGGVVFIRAARTARGHWLEAGESARLERVELSPPGSTRAIRIYDGKRLCEGALQTVYDYSIAIGDGIRLGTPVAGEIDGSAVSGCINPGGRAPLRADLIDAAGRLCRGSVSAIWRRAQRLRGSRTSCYRPAPPPTRIANMTFSACRLLRTLLILMAAPTLLALLEGCASNQGEEQQTVLQTPNAVAVVDTYTTVATITALDSKSRKVTLTTPAGKSTTVKAAKGVDFSQFHIGEFIGVQISEETALEIRPDGAPASAAVATTLGVAGGNTAGAVFDGEAVEISARITLINPKAREVTFQLADGSTKTLKMHKDIDLSGLDVGQSVTVKYALSVLVAVAKP